MTSLTKPNHPFDLAPFVLMALLSPVVAGGLANAWDQVAMLRLEFPPHMVSFAALCAGQENSHVRIVRTICERSGQNEKSPAVREALN